MMYGHEHKDHYNGLERALGEQTPTADSDTISRKRAIEALSTITTYKGSIPYDTAVMRIKRLPPAEPQIIYCKDCRKHNKKIGFDENFHTIWKEDACPLASWRGKAQGHEFDYQFCAFGEKTEATE